MKKAYSYVRFSTPEQSKGDSFRRQTEMAKKYANENGLALVDEGFYDEGISAFRGRNTETGALGDFLEAVKAGVIERDSYLLVENLDRISRSAPRKALRVLEDIVDEGLTVVTLADKQIYTAKQLDKDPKALLLSLITFIRANQESEIKSERGCAVWKAKRAKAKERIITARAPGWVTPNADRTSFILIPERAEIVREIYRLYLSGVGPKLIAKNLNARNEPTWGGGQFWHESTVGKILDNIGVTGTMIPHKIEHDGTTKKRVPQDPVTDYYPEVIDKEMYTHVQSMRRKRNMPGKSELRNALSRLAVCPHCGGSMSRTSKGNESQWIYLVCSRAKAGAGCEYRTVRYYPTVPKFLAGFRYAIASFPTKDARTDKLRENLEFQKYKLTDYQNQLNNIMNLIKAGEIDYETKFNLPDNDEIESLMNQHGLMFPKTITEEILNLEQTIETYENNVNILQAEYDSTSPTMIENKIKDVIGAIDAEDDIKHINAGLRNLCEKIVIDYDNSQCIVHFRHSELRLRVPY